MGALGGDVQIHTLTADFNGSGTNVTNASNMLAAAGGAAQWTYDSQTVDTEANFRLTRLNVSNNSGVTFEFKVASTEGGLSTASYEPFSHDTNLTSKDRLMQYRFNGTTTSEVYEVNISRESTNTSPTQNTPLLNSSDVFTNNTNADLEVIPQGVSDADNDAVKVITDWRLNGTSIMVLNMPFDGGSNSTFTKDYSQFNNNGTVTSAVWNGTGRNNFGAYVFDGWNRNIDVGNNDSLNFTNRNFTVSMWIYPRRNNSGVFWSNKFSYGSNKGFALKHDFCCSGTRNNSLVVFYGQTSITSDILVNVDKWTFVAFTQQGNTGSLYVSGVLDKSFTLSPPTMSVSGKTLIGSQVTSGSTNNFFGMIDDVRVFNRSLSAEQILELSDESNILSRFETEPGNIWMACTTPNDNQTDGAEKCSNNITILIHQPVMNLTLNGTIGNITVRQGRPILLNATLILPDKNVSLVLGTTKLNNSAGSALYIQNFSDIGPYSVNASFNGDANYSERDVTYNISVYDDTIPIINYSSPTPSTGALLVATTFTINVSVIDNLVNYTINFTVYNSTQLVNDTAQYNSTDNALIIYNLIAPKTYFFNVTVIDRGGNSNHTITRNVSLVLTSANFTGNITSVRFRANNATQNGVNATGQTDSVGVYNLTNTDIVPYNFSLKVTLTNDPYKQLILDSEFTNWTVYFNQSINSTYNLSLSCLQLVTSTDNSTFGLLSGRIFYRFNNSLYREFKNSSNNTQILNGTIVFTCPESNYIKKSFDGYNLSGFKNISVDYRGDNSNNNLSFWINNNLCGATTLNDSAWHNLSCGFTFGENPFNISFNLTNKTKPVNGSYIYLDNLYVFNESRTSPFITFKAANSSNYSLATTLTTGVFTRVFEMPINSTKFVWMWIDIVNPPLGLIFDVETLFSRP